MSTFIDCGSVARGFVFSSGEDTTSVVQGFTIQNAVADTGGGALCANGSSPRFEACVFQLNTATVMGGAMACVGSSSPIFRDCTFGGERVHGGRPLRAAPSRA